MNVRVATEVPLDTGPPQGDVARREALGGGRELCAHCAQPVPRGLVRSDSTLQFCCSGCQAVHEILSGAGLDEYYRFRDRLGEAGRPVATAGGGEASEFDSPQFHQLYCRFDEEGQGHTELMLEGVHCAACVWLVERLPRLEPSVVSARLDIARRVVSVVWRPESLGGVSLGRVADGLGKLGYRARPYRAQSAEALHRSELRSLLVRIGIAGAVAGNVMLMAFAMYSGAADAGHMHEAGTMAEGTRRFFEWASLVVSIPALFAGSLFFKGAWSSLRTRVPHMDLPIALGLTVGFGFGTYAVVTGEFDIYFDSLTTLIFALLVGRYTKVRHQMRASEAAELLHAVTPGHSIRLARDGKRHQVPTESITRGDRVVVASGSVLAVDGVVESGDSTVDRSILSGESRPVVVGPGAVVEAGCLNVGRELVVVSMASGAETRVGQLMRDVERAISRRAPLVAEADRLAGGFTVLVLALAVLAALVAWPLGPEVAVDRALSLLIVACPCALGMATPLALSAAVSQAARTQKLVFGAETIEALSRPATIVLDKTGTLTDGRLTVVGRDGSSEFDEVVFLLEERAHHPVARALAAYLEPALDRARLAALVEEPPVIEEHLGRGLEAEVEGRRVAVGSAGFARLLTGADPSGVLGEPGVSVPGASPVYVVVDAHVVARFWVADRVRSDARSALEQLVASGHRLVLLSGDHPDTVSSVAAALSAGGGPTFIDVRGGVSPEEKLAYVEQAKGAGPVFMVGDGVNDAGALAAATVGIAVSGAAEASRLSADVFLARPGVSEVADLALGARRTLRTIRRGIAFSLAYNALGVTLAGLGLLGPLWAAILMPVSSLTVVTNAYRSRMFDRRPTALPNISEPREPS